MSAKISAVVASSPSRRKNDDYHHQNHQLAEPTTLTLFLDECKESAVLENYNDKDQGFPCLDPTQDSRTSSSNEILQLTPSALNNIPGEIEVVSHTVEQRVHTELLQLLDSVEAPDYMFQKIIEWASRAKSKRYNFCPRHSSRSSVIDDFKMHFNLNWLHPTISTVKLESINKKVLVVSSFDFRSQLTSLLTDTSVMQSNNLVLNEAVTNADGSTDCKLVSNSNG
jgi:hypothetical protein